MNIEIDRITACNRDAWDASAEHHLRAERWQALLQGFATPGFSTFDDTLTQLVKSLPVAGKSVVQIGCNNGREILSALAMGASAGLGIDQSAEFLKQAAILRRQAGRDCEFLCANVYQLPDKLHQQFDIGLITIGVLNWMPDLDRFFAAVASLLKPTGQLLIYETHPLLEMFDPNAADPFSPSLSYFEKEPWQSSRAIVYDGASAQPAPVSYWFVHTVADIINASIRSGLSIAQFSEYPHSNRELAYDIYQNRRAQLPLCYSLLATR